MLAILSDKRTWHGQSNLTIKTVILQRSCICLSLHICCVISSSEQKKSESRYSLYVLPQYSNGRTECNNSCELNSFYICINKRNITCYMFVLCYFYTLNGKIYRRRHLMTKAIHLNFIFNCQFQLHIFVASNEFVRTSIYMGWDVVMWLSRIVC